MIGSDRLGCEQFRYAIFEAERQGCLLALAFGTDDMYREMNDFGGSGETRTRLRRSP